MGDRYPRPGHPPRNPAQEHISTVPTYPHGTRRAAVFEPDGLCHCADIIRGWSPRVDVDSWGQCRRCHRLAAS